MGQSGFGVREHTPEEVKELIYSMESEMKKCPQEEIEVTHEFADGLYTRKILIRKGLALTGRVHKQNDYQIVFYGNILIMTEDGTMRQFIGPNTFTSKAGIKPFAIALEDTLYATVHHTHLTDLKEIEAELFEQEECMFDFETGKILQEALPCQQP